MTRTQTSGRRDQVVRQPVVDTPKVGGSRPFGVAGLTCGRCVGALMDALMDLPGTTAVRIAPAYGGTSTVELTGSGTDPSMVSHAVRQAGFRPASTVARPNS
jgi:copper chaperone CopZ